MIAPHSSNHIGQIYILFSVLVISSSIQQVLVYLLVAASSSGILENWRHLLLIFWNLVEIHAILLDENATSDTEV